MTNLSETPKVNLPIEKKNDANIESDTETETETDAEIEKCLIGLIIRAERRAKKYHYEYHFECACERLLKEYQLKLSQNEMDKDKIQNIKSHHNDEIKLLRQDRMYVLKSIRFHYRIQYTLKHRKREYENENSGKVWVCPSNYEIYMKPFKHISVISSVHH